MRRGRALIPQKMSENGPLVAEMAFLGFASFKVGVTGHKSDMARRRVGTRMY